MLNEIDLSVVDLNLLVLFDTVFETRHVGAAAGRLHVSSSAVSHGLRRLRQLFDDPLFLKTPKGVVPTARAERIAAPIRDILQRVKGVMGALSPFDPAVSVRRFTIGAPDATIAVLLPRLMSALRREAPRIDLSLRHLLPQTGLLELESGTIDLVVVALDEVPLRFFSEVVHEEEFVIAARRGHPFLKKPSLRAYCDLLHIVVSIAGDSRGNMDDLLEKQGKSRRVALSVPHFMLALSALSNTDLLAAVPRSLVRAHGTRFGLASVKAPLPLRRFQLRAIAPKVALADPGVAWLFGAVQRAAKA